MNSLPPSDAELDGLLRECLANFSSILDDLHHLEDSLKSGRLFLAKTRRDTSSSGASISQISYNRAEMSTRGATSRVQVQEVNISQVPTFTLVDELGSININSSSTVTSTIERSADPIHWFSGVLVPAPLRHAQSCFRRSLRLVIELTNKRASLLVNSQRLSELVKLRKAVDSGLSAESLVTKVET